LNIRHTHSGEQIGGAALAPIRAEGARKWMLKWRPIRISEIESAKPLTPMRPHIYGPRPGMARMAMAHSVAQALLAVPFILHSQEWLCHQPRATAILPVPSLARMSRCPRSGWPWHNQLAIQNSKCKREDGASKTSDGPSYRDRCQSRIANRRPQIVSRQSSIDN